MRTSVMISAPIATGLLGRDQVDSPGAVSRSRSPTGEPLTIGIFGRRAVMLPIVLKFWSRSTKYRLGRMLKVW